MIADRFEVDPQYFAEKYSIPVTARKADAPAALAASSTKTTRLPHTDFFD